MAIQSIDQLVTAISAGKINRYQWNKITGGSPMRLAGGMT